MAKFWVTALTAWVHIKYPYSAARCVFDVNQDIEDNFESEKSFINFDTMSYS